ncbi:hypothetical protein GOODEAATRI_031299 [Goodea atripinnis]|uniref:Phorbol-ester/DAG-type domain-containing protein n=1 Tax=Goodea atripinnis TaxID=208336 RepID=A0ABV0P9B8_9TELE
MVFCLLQNKEKERLKEREKETREREARSSSGHLFTSLSVSATTLCSSCNKSITAKEALSCPGCNVTIHNRCRDSVASCAKMKQRQQKLTLVRNNSALQNVALRTKSESNFLSFCRSLFTCPTSCAPPTFLSSLLIHSSNDEGTSKLSHLSLRHSATVPARIQTGSIWPHARQECLHQ